MTNKKCETYEKLCNCNWWLKESLEREHSVAMEKMKAKMVELRSEHIVAMDKLRKKHVDEKKQLKNQLDEYRRMEPSPRQVKPLEIHFSMHYSGGHSHATH